MAREVNATLGKIITAERGLTEAQGEDIVKRLRTNNLYQVSPTPHISRIIYLHLNIYGIEIENIANRFRNDPVLPLLPDCPLLTPSVVLDA